LGDRFTLPLPLRGADATKKICWSLMNSLCAVVIELLNLPISLMQNNFKLWSGCFEHYIKIATKQTGLSEFAVFIDLQFSP
jgi:hypothetical protein